MTTDADQMSRSASLPSDLAALVRHMAIQRIRKGLLSRKNPLLWSGAFPMPGMGGGVFIEVTRCLELRVVNRVTGEVLAQTMPVSFGPLAPNDKTLAERFEQWCAERRGGTVPAGAESAEARQAEEGGHS